MAMKEIVLAGSTAVAKKGPSVSGLSEKLKKVRSQLKEATAKKTELSFMDRMLRHASSGAVGFGVAKLQDTIEVSTKVNPDLLSAAMIAALAFGSTKIEDEFGADTVDGAGDVLFGAKIVAPRMSKTVVQGIDEALFEMSGCVDGLDREEVQTELGQIPMSILLPLVKMWIQRKMAGKMPSQKEGAQLLQGLLDSAVQMEGVEEDAETGRIGDRFRAFRARRARRKAGTKQGRAEKWEAKAERLEEPRGRVEIIEDKRGGGNDEVMSMLREMQEEIAKLKKGKSSGNEGYGLDFTEVEDY